MFDNSLILFYFCIIIILQSIVGVGVLVLGTPFLLILEFSIVDALFILLPISIVTSFINLIIMNFSNQNLNKSTYKEFKKFFAVCIPSIFSSSDEFGYIALPGLPLFTAEGILSSDIISPPIISRP